MQPFQLTSEKTFHELSSNIRPSVYEPARRIQVTCTGVSCFSPTRVKGREHSYPQSGVSQSDRSTSSPSPETGPWRCHSK